MDANLRQQTVALGTVLRDQPALVRLKDAEQALGADREASHLLEEFQRVQVDLRLKQMSGGLTQGEIQHFRSLRAEVGQAAAITRLARAQREAAEYLQQVNAELSELLGLDFALLARPASGCC